MKRYIFLIFGITALDQFIKFWVRSTLSPTDYIELIPNLIHLTYQENRGVSFSFLSNLPDALRVPLLTGVSLLVILGLGYYLLKDFARLSQLDRWGFSLILSGALGNLIDRGFRHSVTDYMFFHFYETGFFVNNLADDLISIGFVLVLWRGLLGSKDEEG